MTGFRFAGANDANAIMDLYREIPRDIPGKDPVMLDNGLLSLKLGSSDHLWFLAENDGKAAGVLSAVVDNEHGLAKLNRFYMRAPGSEKEGGRRILGELIKAIKSSFPALDVLYATTRTLSMEQLSLTTEIGFRILGIFPKAAGADLTELSGMAAYFFRDTLGKNRYSDFHIHPAVQSFYEIAARACSLEKLPAAASEFHEELSRCPLPVLETIDAKNFILKRFNDLKTRGLGTVNFYPFQEPNLLITDPGQEIEIFIKMIPEIKFAAIISEHLNLRVDPAGLYRHISGILRSKGATYIEVINDAADALGIDYVLKAGFAPCAFFPALKRHGSRRRDFLIFGKGFEKKCYSRANINAVFLEYLDEYQKIAEKTF